MSQFFRKNPYIKYLALAIVFLAGFLLLRFGKAREVLIFVNDEDQTVRTNALTVEGVLQSAGITLGEYDQVMPSLDSKVKGETVIQVLTARPVTLHTPEDVHSLFTAEQDAASILLEAGIIYAPQDRVLLNGREIDPHQPLDKGGSLLLQYIPPITIRVEIDGQEEILSTLQPTLGAALEEASIEVHPQDFISEDLNVPVEASLDVIIRRARLVTVSAGEMVLSGLSAAKTVGGALQDMGMPLQNMDYSQPGENEPLPENGEIQVMKVREAVLLSTDEVAYENEYVEDPETLLDTYSVIEPGQVGIYATRERITYVNDEEIRRMLEEEWQASEPRNGVMGFGTKVEIRTEVVDGITLEYWRKKTVYATSYQPCDNQGVCHDGTAGGYPLQQGIVAVTPQWYSVPNGLAMADLPVYIPGYGRAIIGDVGGGIPGTPWIDLAYRPENYVSWHHWTTMYFLTPVPAYYPAIITP